MNKKTACFCTIISNNYLIKGVALYESIRKQTSNDFFVWMCTIDKYAYNVLKKLDLPNTAIIHAEEFESESLLNAKQVRTQAEYCWTLKASFIKHILHNFKNIGSLLYVDSDTYLFSDPYTVFDKLKRHAVLLTCHNFIPMFEHLYEEKGFYNAGVIGFTNNRASLKILDWWENKCIEWCYDIVSDGKFADQKYLDDVGKNYKRVYKMKSIGGNAAMWNIGNCKIEVLDNKTYIDDEILHFFHFSNFYIISESEFDIWNCEYGKIPEKAKQYIFVPYANAIYDVIQKIKEQEEDIKTLLSGKQYNNSLYNYVKIDG